MLKAKLTLENSLNLLITLGLVLCSYNLWALSTDQDQPIEVLADYAELDDEKGITIYRGNVIVTQGSMEVTGDELTVLYDEAGELDTMIVEGQPSHFEQLPDNSSVKDEAEALRMEFYSAKNLLYLFKKAVMKQENSRLSGDKIEYNTLTNKIISKGASQNDPTQKGPDGRVKIILQKQKKPTEEKP